MSIETDGMLVDIDMVLKQHISKQMEKISEENKKMKITMHILKNTPLFADMKKENDQLKKNNNILAKNILKLQKKIEKYENHPNINLEIKEIVGSDEEKLTVAEINWAKLVNSKIEDEESSLEEELAIAGINDIADDDCEYDDDEEDENDEDNREDEEDDEKINIENILDNEGDQLENAPVWTHGIEDNFNNDDDEISDNEEGAKIYIFQDKKYYVEDKKNGKIFENIEGKLGKVVGRLEDGVPFFS